MTHPAQAGVQGSSWEPCWEGRAQVDGRRDGSLWTRACGTGAGWGRMTTLSFEHFPGRHFHLLLFKDVRNAK